MNALTHHVTSPSLRPAELDRALRDWMTACRVEEDLSTRLRAAKRERVLAARVLSVVMEGAVELRVGTQRVTRTPAALAPAALLLRAPAEPVLLHDVLAVGLHDGRIIQAGDIEGLRGARRQAERLALRAPASRLSGMAAPF